MAYERDGVSGAVSDHLDCDEIDVDIVSERPDDQPYVRVTHFPWDTDPDDDALPDLELIPLGEQHEVTYWDPTTEKEIMGFDDPISPVIETYYRVAGADRACDLAADVARENDVVIWDTIIRLRPRVVVSSLGVQNEDGPDDADSPAGDEQEVYKTIEGDPKVALRETDDGSWVAINRVTEDWATGDSREEVLEQVRDSPA